MPDAYRGFGRPYKAAPHLSRRERSSREATG
jgi:hypothetical protein